MTARKGKPRRKPRKAPMPRRMTPDERAAFVLAWCDGRVTSSVEVPADLIPHVFMPLGLGAGDLFRGWTRRDLARLGLIWADAGRDQTLRMGVNGFPIFTSCRLMLREDWLSLRPAIVEEMKRRKALRP